MLKIFWQTIISARQIFSFKFILINDIKVQNVAYIAIHMNIKFWSISTYYYFDYMYIYSYIFLGQQTTRVIYNLISTKHSTILHIIWIYIRVYFCEKLITLLTLNKRQMQNVSVTIPWTIESITIIIYKAITFKSNCR